MDQWRGEKGTPCHLQVLGHHWGPWKCQHLPEEGNEEKERRERRKYLFRPRPVQTAFPLNQAVLIGDVCLDGKTPKDPDSQ
jgi:hypothetical protein